jgi:hypothetical protein
MTTESTTQLEPTLKNVKLTERLLKRFRSKIDKSGPIPSHVPDIGNCWDWKGVIEGTGYGSISQGRKGFFVHRVSYLLEYGQFDESLCVLHKCDRRSCLRPSHLFLGTKGDNCRDMATKGRAASGDRNGRRLYPESIPRGDNHHARRNPERLARGERTGGSKLKEADVRWIRANAHPKKRNIKGIARKFGVSGSTIAYIFHRKTWNHIE